MQVPPGEIEPTGPEHQAGPKDPILSPLNGFYTFLEAFVLCYFIAFILGTLWRDGSVRLKVLHTTMRLLQRFASEIGIMALRTERVYYETIDTLH